LHHSPITTTATAAAAAAACRKSAGDLARSYSMGVPAAGIAGSSSVQYAVPKKEGRESGTVAQLAESAEDADDVGVQKRIAQVCLQRWQQQQQQQQEQPAIIITVLFDQELKHLSGALRLCKCSNTPSGNCWC
jgi:hypothetical protein